SPAELARGAPRAQCAVTAWQSACSLLAWRSDDPTTPAPGVPYGCQPMPHPSFEPFSPPPDRPVPPVPEVRTEGFDGVRDIEALGRVASVIGHELTNVLQVLSNSIDRLPDPAASARRIVKMARAS